MPSILIVDDHTLYREAIRDKLNAELGMEVVGEAGDAATGVARALELKPDIVLMDIDMPGASSFEAVRRICEQLPECRVIILSAHKYDRHIKDAIAARAAGYALKSGDFQQVKMAIHDVLAGRPHYVPEILARIQMDNGKLSLSDSPKTVIDSMTRRERELFHYLVQGRTLKEAATQMGVEYKTADKHKVNMMRKLGVHDRMELVHIAVREGILPT